MRRCRRQDNRAIHSKVLETDNGRCGAAEPKKTLDARRVNRSRIEMNKAGYEFNKNAQEALDIITRADKKLLYALCDTGAFNSIIRGYICMTLDAIHADDSTKDRAMQATFNIFDTATANEADHYISR